MAGRDVPLNGVQEEASGPRRRVVVAGAVATCLLAGSAIAASSAWSAYSKEFKAVSVSSSLPGPLAGVNVGGWLCLEDWFYSGPGGSHVMTMDNGGQGACLPPAVPSLDALWPSEGNLTFTLNKTKGPNFTIHAFQAHRHAFIGEDDLAGMASLGLSSVRVPMTWAAFADALAPLDKDIYGKHNPHDDTVIVPDPFYHDQAAFATIPRGWLEEFMRRCAKHGLKVLIDLHAFPGGSADGTYNGVWPAPPVFWKNKTIIGADKNQAADLTEVGLWIAKAVVAWLEGLDEQTHAGLLGLTFMNEPAHTNAWKKFANETLVLQWLGSAADIFRKSKLPAKGVKLYMQMIATAFVDFTGTAVTWYNKTFTEDERKNWVVADQHWYTAWDKGGCDMRTSEDGGLTCDAPLDKIQQKMKGCVESFSKGFTDQFGSTALKAITEFSVGTTEEARMACNDRAVLKTFLQEQLVAFDQAGLQPFFWTWRMPFGPVFEPGWSLRWIAGLEEPHQAMACNLPHGSTPVIS